MVYDGLIPQIYDEPDFQEWCWVLSDVQGENGMYTPLICNTTSTRDNIMFHDLCIIKLHPSYQRATH